jgi:hypothetical protein
MGILDLDLLGNLFHGVFADEWCSIKRPGEQARLARA